MGYGKRIDTLCALLTPARSFADVGCDHGYCSQYVLQNGLCDNVIFSDISKGSLQKAERLLRAYVIDGRAKPVLGGGFYGVPKDTQEVLIAGMGGSEIVGILSDKKYGFIPEKFVFQPMHDAEKLRKYLLDNGGYIERDYTFFDKKYYDVIVGGTLNGRSKQTYSALELEFGKENLDTRPEAFLERTKKQYRQVCAYLLRENMQEESKQELLARKNRLQEVLGYDDETTV